MNGSLKHLALAILAATAFKTTSPAKKQAIAQVRELAWETLDGLNAGRIESLEAQALEQELGERAAALKVFPELDELAFIQEA